MPGSSRRSLTSSHSAGAAQRLLDALAAGRRRCDAVKRRPGGDVVEDRHRRERVRLLEDHADRAAHGDDVDARAVDVDVVEQDLALGARAGDLLVHAVDAAHQRRLAAARRADDRRHLVGAEVEVDALDRVRRRRRRRCRPVDRDARRCRGGAAPSRGALAAAVAGASAAGARGGAGRRRRSRRSASGVQSSVVLRSPVGHARRLLRDDEARDEGEQQDHHDERQRRAPGALSTSRSLGELTSLKICTGSEFMRSPRLNVVPLTIVAVNSSGAVSPAARATASSDAGDDARQRRRQHDAAAITRQRGAPSASAASRSAVGHEQQHDLGRARDDRQHQQRRARPSPSSRRSEPPTAAEHERRCR